MKRLLIWFGRALSVAGILFIADRFYQLQGTISFGDLGIIEFLLLIIFALIYGLANLALAVGWHFALKHVGAEPSFAWSIRTYAATQLAKYIPGNIFQFIGRQTLGAVAGHSQSSLLKSSVFELLLPSSIGACSAILLLPRIVSWVPLEAAIILFLLVGVAGLFLVSHLFSRQLRNAVLCYAGQVLVSSLIFTGILVLAGGTIDSIALFIGVASSFTIAWLIGLVTPGAPAGLGAREAALVLLLAGLAPESTILVAAVMGRLVSTLGDLLFFLVGRKY